MTTLSLSSASQQRCPRWLFSLALAVMALSGNALAAAGQTVPPSAAVASAHPLATAAGEEILRGGGNAFDAAVAVSAALAVVEPTGSGLGGGGFWLLHRAQDGFEVMVDGRERAPRDARADMYLDKQGEPLSRASLDGPQAAAIPGEPAALAHIAEKYGRLPLTASLAPAIRYAREGVPVLAHYRRMAELRREALLASPAAARTFLVDGDVPREGEIIRQPDLADTLETLAQQGRKGFYEGTVARRLIKGVRRAGGIWRMQDLKGYRVAERQPVRIQYRDMRITTAALPSSGGIVLGEILHVLAGFDLRGPPGWQRQHVIIEAMRLAYRDRARYLGDSDFVRVDSERLMSREHAAQLRALIDTRLATPSHTLDAQPPAAAGAGADTSHLSIIDQEGNRVAATLSINYPFGSAFMPAGTGVVLNNEMDDFIMKPGTPNVYGLVGSAANAIAPGKRPLSSMSPTFLETDGAVVILGTPGGSRIISMVLLAALELAEGRGDVRDWVALPRYHHQYLPDKVEYEPGALDAVTHKRLKKMGHVLDEKERPYGNMQAVLWDKRRNQVRAASDPRGEGEARVIVPNHALPARLTEDSSAGVPMTGQ